VGKRFRVIPGAEPGGLHLQGHALLPFDGSADPITTWERGFSHG
jgi:hypothetical protein